MNGRNTTRRNSTRYHLVSRQTNLTNLQSFLTIDVDHSITLTDQPLGGPEYVPEADTEPNLLYNLSKFSNLHHLVKWDEGTHLVGIFGVNIILNGYMALFPEIIGCNLHKVGDLGLVVCHCVSS